jgi:hypothetical protein
MCPPGTCDHDDELRRHAVETAPGAAPRIVHQVLQSPGSPLPASARRDAEQRLGHDFGRVRVHTDAQAAESARAVEAHAYTVGNHVVFGTGRFAPSTSSGHHLLLHELVHTVQQTGSGAGIAPSSLQVSTPADPAEQEAERIATAALHGVRLSESPIWSIPPGRRAAMLAPLISDYSGQPVTVIHRSESVHPEEQFCEDLSKNSEAPCSAIIECINDLIEILAGRFAGYRGDPGHLTRIKIVQGILKTLMVLAMASCKGGEYDKELQEEAEKWADKNPAQQAERGTGPPTEEQKKTLSERLPSVPKWVWGVISGVAAALIILCFASGACEVGAIIAAAGEAIGWIIVAAMRLAGIGLLAQSGEPAPSATGNGTSGLA